MKNLFCLDLLPKSNGSGKMESCPSHVLPKTALTEFFASRTSPSLTAASISVPPPTCKASPLIPTASLWRVCSTTPQHHMLCGFGLGNWGHLLGSTLCDCHIIIYWFIKLLAKTCHGSFWVCCVCLAAPYWIKQPKSQLYAPGETVKLECTADGIPSPAVTWSINGNPLSGNWSI